MELKRLFPPEGYINSTLVPGSIYYFPEESITSKEPHYFVVLNASPLQQTILLLACGTSRIEKAHSLRKNLPPQTVVLITPEECPIFPKTTAFDCNSLITKTKSQMYAKKASQTILYKGTLPEHLLKKLMSGVQESPLIENKLKKLLLV